MEWSWNLKQRSEKVWQPLFGISTVFQTKDKKNCLNSYLLIGLNRRWWISVFFISLWDHSIPFYTMTVSKKAYSSPLTSALSHSRTSDVSLSLFILYLCLYPSFIPRHHTHFLNISLSQQNVRVRTMFNRVWE